MSKRLAATIVFGSVLVSLCALGPAYVSWAPTLPAGMRFEVGDRASIEDTMLQLVDETREHMRRELALPLHLLAVSFVAASSVIAWLLLRSSDRHADTPATATQRDVGRALSEAEFWRLIAKLDWQQTGDDEAVCAPLVAALATKPVAAIEAFEERLAQKLHALDTEARAREIGELAYIGSGDGFSVDQFLYARCCVVANGQRQYETVLADPKQMPKDMEFEALLGVAAAAYEAKTGAAWDFTPMVSYETFANGNGWPR